MSKKNWISTSDHGDHGSPGQQYYKCFAGICAAKNGQYELHVESEWGSNQGYLQPNGRHERRYRSYSLDELLKIGVSEIRTDSDFQPPDKFLAAIRDAIFEAQDAAVTPDAE